MNKKIVACLAYAVTLLVFVGIGYGATTFYNSKVAKFDDKQIFFPAEASTPITNNYLTKQVLLDNKNELINWANCEVDPDMNKERAKSLLFFQDATMDYVKIPKVETPFTEVLINSDFEKSIEVGIYTDTGNPPYILMTIDKEQNSSGRYPIESFKFIGE